MGAREAFDLYMVLCQEDSNISAVNIDPERGGNGERRNYIPDWCATFAINFERVLDEMYQTAIMLAHKDPRGQQRAVYYNAEKGFDKLDAALPLEVIEDGERIRSKLFG